jgi:hypothetical protein
MHAATSTAAQRRSALALHSMSSADREWMLARLPAEAGARLTALVDELRSLGLPPDPQLVKSAVSAPAVAALGHAARPPVLRLAALLSDEPARLVAHALTTLPPEDRERVMDALPLARRPRIRTELLAIERRLTPPAPALVEAIAQELRASVPIGQAPAPRALDRLRARLRRLAGRRR